VNEGDEEREMEMNNYEDDRRFSVQGYCVSDKDFQINQNNFLKGNLLFHILYFLKAYLKFI
jgi:hypothetical protein